MWRLSILPYYFCKWNSRSNYIMHLVIIHWRILPYFFWILLCLHMSVILTVIKAVLAVLGDRRVGRTNRGTFGVALRFQCSGLSEFWLQLSSSIPDALSASQSSSLWFGFSQSRFQFSQFLVSEMVSGEQSSSHSAGWWSIRVIRQTFDTWVLPSGRTCADIAGGTGPLSDNLDAARPSCWKFN